MSSSDQLYANGRIAVLSNKLLGADKFARLAESSSLAEAVRVLVESGYGGGVAVAENDYEQLLRHELDSAMALIKELCFDTNAAKYFLCKYDYANAKTLVKGKYMRQDYISYCFENASYDPAVMQSSFLVDDYSQVSKNMAEALNAIDEQFANGNRSPQTIDRLLDKAMYKDMRTYAKRSSISMVQQLFDWQVNTTNLMLVYRLKKAGLTKDAFISWLVDGGSVKRDTLLSLWDSELTAIDLPDELASFYKLCGANFATLAEAERAQAAGRNKIVRDNADMLTIQPVVEYFFKKVEETERVRRLLVEVKEGRQNAK